MFTLFSVLPFAVCLVWTVTLLLEYRKNSLPLRALTVFGLDASLLYLCHFLHFNQLGSPVWESIYYLCNLSVFPMYGLYVKQLTSGEALKWKNYALWLLPALLVFLWSLSGVSSPGLVLQVVRGLFFLVSLLSALLAARDLSRYRKRVDNFYSDPEGKRLNPVLAMLCVLLSTLLCSVLANAIGRSSFEHSSLLWIPSSLFSVLLYCVFFTGTRTRSEAGKIQETPAPDKSEETLRLLMEKIQDQVVTQELFRRKGLTINDLAEAVCSNRTYVSQCINQFCGMSFSEYVNRERVRYATRLLDEHPETSLTDTADLSGFNERTSFYRNFKKFAGVSPGEYRPLKGR